MHFQLRSSSLFPSVFSFSLLLFINKTINTQSISSTGKTIKSKEPRILTNENDYEIYYKNTSHPILQEDNLFHQTLFYEITKQKNNKLLKLIPTIYSAGCQIANEDNSLKIENSTILNDTGKVHLSIDSSSKSLIFSYGLEYCIRADLYADGLYGQMTSMSYVTTNFFSTFHSTNMLHVYENVNQEVISCICSKNDVYNCNDASVEENEDMEICIQAIETFQDYNGINVNELSFEPVQSNNSHRFKQSIMGGMIRDRFTEIKVENNGTNPLLIIKTRITNIFSNETKSPIIMKGSAQLSINNRNLAQQSREKESKKESEFMMLIQVKRSPQKEDLSSSMINTVIAGYDHYGSKISLVLIISLVVTLSIYFYVDDENAKKDDDSDVSEKNNSDNEINGSDSKKDNIDVNESIVVEDDPPMSIQKIINSKRSSIASNNSAFSTNSNDAEGQIQNDTESRTSIQLPTSYNNERLSLFDDSNDDDDQWDYDDYEGYKAAIVDTIFKNNKMTQSLTLTKPKQSMKDDGEENFSSCDTVELV